MQMSYNQRHFGSQKKGKKLGLRKHSLLKFDIYLKVGIYVCTNAWISYCMDRMIRRTQSKQWP